MLSLSVGTVTGKIIQLKAKPSDSILHLKKKIQDMVSISVDSQVLVWKKKQLSNQDILADIGLLSGAKLDLVVQMSSGAGPIQRPKKTTSKQDSVVLLLCKQSDGLYMLEFQMKDGTIDKSAAAKQVYKLSSAGLPQLLLAEINDALEDGSEDFVFETSRPDSGASAFSSLSDLSILDTEYSISSESEYSSLHDQYNSISTPEVLEFMSMSTPLNVFGTSGAAIEKKILVKKSRPATAISLMRLPDGEKPAITITTSRPSTASSRFKCDNKGSTSESRENDDTKVCTTSKSECNKLSERKNTSADTLKHSDSDVKSSARVKKTGSITRPTSVLFSALKSTSPGPKLTKPNGSIRGSAVGTRTQPRKKSSAVTKENGPKPVLKCHSCNLKLLATTCYKCKCSHMFCSTHRYSDRHDCSFNYREAGKAVLLKENPKVIGEKINKI